MTVFSLFISLVSAVCAAALRCCTSCLSSRLCILAICGTTPVALLALGCTRLEAQNQQQSTRQQEKSLDNESAESLHDSFREAQTDSARAYILNELAFTYRYRAPDSLLAHANAALAYAHKARTHDAIVRAKGLIGYAFDNQGKYDRAFEQYSEALALAQTLGDRKSVGQTLNLLGNLNKRMGRYTKALEAFDQAQQIFASIGRQSQFALILSNVATIHELQGNYEAALQAQSHAASLLDSIGHPDRIIAHCRLGQLLVKDSRFEQALASFYVVVRHPRQNEYKRFFASALCSVAYIYAKQHKTEQALHCINEGLQAASEAGSRNELSQNYKLAAETFAALNNSEQAITYYKQYSELKDSLLSDQQQNRIEHLQEQLAAARATVAKEQEIQQLKSNNAVQFIIRNSLVVSLVLALAVAALAYNRYRLKQRSEAQMQSLNSTLAAANAHLQNLHQEKNEMLEVVAHDLKNPLASIILSVETLLQFGYKIPDNKRTERYQSMLTVAQRMNHIIKTLIDTRAAENDGTYSQHRALSFFDVRQTITAAVAEYDERAAAKTIHLHWQSPTTVGRVYADEQAVSEILDNLISNAVKYSPHGSTVTIKVSDDHAPAQTLTGNNSLCVSIRDEGPGLSEDDKLHLFEKFTRLSAKPTGGEESTGLGLSIVKKLADAMNARVWCESELGHGATFYLALPTYPQSNQPATA